MSDYFYYIASLAIDGLITLYFAEQYFSSKKLFTTFTKSIENGINCVNEDEKDTQYAVVRGQVKSIGPPIRSLNKRYASGVIQKLTMKEFYTEKTSFGMWVNREELMDEKKNVVPFQLERGKFKINITSPLDAEFLNLEVIEDVYEPTSSTFLGFLFGIQKRGIQHTEWMLKERSILTGFGEVQTKNGIVHLIPPRNGMCYILTTMDPESLTKVLASKKKYYGACCIIFSIVGIMIAGACAYKYWKSRMQRRRLERMNEFAEQASAERRRRTANTTPSDIEFTCIVCQ
ncbi:mitochondrial E3 ubiquitin protein ligase 1-like isoform X2 [Planococcus citri]|uniref:mitochondrial E3 ubiquitin protein ligase 1-like isoform X2 n=1 Tax=Planococcus citri TaxID=170843 RepID=UPI0031F8CFBC